MVSALANKSALDGTKGNWIEISEERNKSVELCGLLMRGDYYDTSLMDNVAGYVPRTCYAVIAT